MPQQYWREVLDHLGLVAGMFEEPGMHTLRGVLMLPSRAVDTAIALCNRLRPPF